VRSPFLFDVGCNKITEGGETVEDLTLNDLFSWKWWWNGVLDFGTMSLEALFILLLAWIVMRIRSKLIHRIFQITRMDEKKEATLASLLLSLTRYAIYILAFLMVLRSFEIDIAPILAAAGILGLAVGFGAQNLVKDVLYGFFIIFEDQMHVGDYVTVNNINGTVEEVGLRMTVIREWSGKRCYLANSEIKQVNNYNREQMRPIVNFTIPYEYSPEEMKPVIDEVCEKLNETYKDHLLIDDQGLPIEKIQLYGITDVENNALGAKYTIICLCKDTSYWTMGKEIRHVFLEQFKQRGIPIAYPRRIYGDPQPQAGPTRQNSF
jgi:small-conductance mechanosensitive channel